MSSYHHHNLRGQLVTAAISHVRAHGAETLSIRALTGSLGVTPNAAYRHFPSRQRLLEEVVAHARRDLHHRLQQYLSHATPPGDAGTAEPTEALCREYIAYARTEPHLFRVLFTPTPAAANLDGAHGCPSPPPGGCRRPLTSTVLAWSTIHGFAMLIAAGPLRNLADLQLDRLTTRVIAFALNQPAAGDEPEQSPSLIQGDT